jgi:protein ImuB
VLVPSFSAVALVRSEPELRDHPVAVVRGAPPARVIVDATAEAKAAGIEAEMPEAQARARCLDLITRPVSEERDRLAHTAMLATVLGTSPRVEDGGPGVVYVDLEGLGRLFGDEAAIGARLWHHARGIGLPACVGIAGSRASARAAARLGRPVTRIAPGGEAAALGKAPLRMLEPPADLHARLLRWGVRTIGDLAALPRTGLGKRLGEVGLRLQDLARGIDSAPFQLYTLPPLYQEAQGLEWEITSLVDLEPVMRGLLDRLVARLGLSHLAADRLTIGLGLASGAREEWTLALAHPLDDARTMLALLRLELERHPVSSAIVHVAVEAHPVRVHADQGGLGRPPGPGARDLTAVLARLSALVGPTSLGSPALVDSHRPGVFQLVPFDPAVRGGPIAPRVRERDARDAGQEPRDPGGDAVNPGREARDPGRKAVSRGPEGRDPGEERGTCRPGSLALRRLRPWVAAEVHVYAERPVWMTAGSIAGHVVACAGPWRTSGEWWGEVGDARGSGGSSESGGSGGSSHSGHSGGSSGPGGWAHDEWDIALSDDTLCRLVWDQRARAWFLDGIYD